MVIKEFKGVCTSCVSYSIDDKGLVHNIEFEKGCDGNLKAVALLSEGKPAHEVAAALQGLCCGNKSTSCPDQFAQALLEDIS